MEKKTVSYRLASRLSPRWPACSASADWVKVLEGGGSVWVLPNRSACYWTMCSQEVQSESCKDYSS